MTGKDIFFKIADRGRDFFRSIWLQRYLGIFKDSYNNMFDSAQVGSIGNNNVSVRTTTVTMQDDGKDPITCDMVVLNVNDACDTELEVLLTKQDCVELIAYLSTAAFALRD